MCRLGPRADRLTGPGSCCCRAKVSLLSLTALTSVHSGLLSHQELRLNRCCTSTVTFQREISPIRPPTAGIWSFQLINSAVSARALSVLSRTHTQYAVDYQRARTFKQGRSLVDQRLGRSFIAFPSVALALLVCHGHAVYKTPLYTPHPVITVNDAACVQT